MSRSIDYNSHGFEIHCNNILNNTLYYCRPLCSKPATILIVGFFFFIPCVAGIRLCSVDVVGGAGGRPTRQCSHHIGRPVPVQQRPVRFRLQARRRRRVQRGGGRRGQQEGLLQLFGPQRSEAHRHLHGRQGRFQGHRRPSARSPDTGRRPVRSGSPCTASPVARPMVSPEFIIS